MSHSEPASSPAPTPTTSDPSAGRLVVLAVTAGLVAGVVSWLIGEAVVTAFRPPYVAQHVMGQTIMKASFQDQSAADTKNATLAFAVLGGMLGAALGMAGGLARKSTRAGLESAAVGLALGVVLGAAASLALLPVYFIALERAQEELSRDLNLPLLVHGGIWAACGLAGGAAFGIGLGAGRSRVLNAALGGLIGALVGAVLYEMIGAMAFPGSKTTSPLPIDGKVRLLARLLVATLSGTLAAVVINMRGRHPTTAKT